MLMSTLKNYVNELIVLVKQTKLGCEYAKKLQFVDSYKDSTAVNEALINTLSSILKEFWSEVFDRLPSSTWEADELKWEFAPRILPWLAFQRKIAVDIGKERAEYLNQRTLGKESADLIEPPSFNECFHHEIFYNKIAALYTAAGNSQLELSVLIALIQTVGRGLDYAEKNEALDNTYPLTRLDKQVEQFNERRPHLLAPVKRLLSQVAALFYLFHCYCTPKQQALLFSLIQYRSKTTAEERCTEAVLIKCLKELSGDWRKFFKKNEALIDLAPLSEYRACLPQKRTNFLLALQAPPAIYGFAEQPVFKSEAERLTNTVQLLRKNFIARKTARLTIIDFAEEIWPVFSFYNVKEQRHLWRAIYICALECYIKERQQEARPTAIFAYSKETKCQAAREIINYLNGQPSKAGFFQEKKNRQASQQGRLGVITVSFENKQCELGLS